MIHIDEKTLFSEIKKRAPRTVILSSPEGLMAKTLELAAKIRERLNVKVITVADTCYGICDIVDEEVNELEADLVFHIGHNVTRSKLGKKTIIIKAIDDIEFEKVLRIALPTLEKYRKIGLCTISQHLHQLNKAKSFFRENRIEALLGKGKELLNDGQVFGCNFSTAFCIRNNVEAFAFLGQSIFHATGIEMATNRKTFMLDPYYKEVQDISEKASCIIKKATLSVCKARDVDSIGILIGLKEGQCRLKKAIMFEKELRRLGKEVSLIALHEINYERLLQLKKIGALIQTACPRITIDGEGFDIPFLSIPEAEALIRLLKGKEIGEIFQKSRWI